jgi:hypothetical protein
MSTVLIQYLFTQRDGACTSDNRDQIWLASFSLQPKMATFEPLFPFIHYEDSAQ